MDDKLYELLLNISYSCVIASIIIIIITTGGSGQNALTALISGYSLLEAGIIIMTWLISTKLNLGENMSVSSGIINNMSIVFKGIKELFPFFLLIFIISIIIALLGIYFNKISTGKVSDEYYSYSNLSTFFILAQICIILYNIKDVNIKISGKLFSLLMLLGTINTIIVITLLIVLKFYTTDC